MRIVLIILAILWLVYRLTPLNETVNEYFGLEGTLLDTSDTMLSDIFSGEYDSAEVEQGTTVNAKHTILTFVPAVILIGIALVL